LDDSPGGGSDPHDNHWCQAIDGAACVSTQYNPTGSALADPGYRLPHAGFFASGFNIYFLVTHLPGAVQLCRLPAQVASWSLAIIGLANIVGSLLTGRGTQNYRRKFTLFWMYFSRAILITAYLLAPKNRPDLLSLRGRPWPGLAGDRAAHCRYRRQTVWHPLSGDFVGAHVAFPSNRRFFWCLVRWHRIHNAGQFSQRRAITTGYGAPTARWHW